MKKQPFIFLLSAIVSTATAQTTLQHFDPTVITPVVESYGPNAGYYTGHNSYGDEEFAEKYEISGSAQLLGVSAIHLGQDGTSGTVLASYRAYTVATNGLPGSQLASKSVAYSQVPVNGTLTSQMFTAPVSITGNFFVSFNLGDYAHGGAGTKLLALSHSPHGTRSTSDLSVYGRNAIRFHSHGVPDWNDYQTENFTNYSPAVHFSLFPIVELGNLSVVDFDKKGNIGAVYPNPSSGKFAVPIATHSGGDAQLKLFDMSGKLVSEKQTRLSSGKTDFIFDDPKLQSGIYLLWIKTPEGSISQRVVIQ